MLSTTPSSDSRAPLERVTYNISVTTLGPKVSPKDLKSRLTDFFISFGYKGVAIRISEEGKK